MGSTFGNYFKVTTYGESHGFSVGCTVDGIPPGMELDAKTDIQPQLLIPPSTRRRPGQSAITTPRNEEDIAIIQSGCEGGITLGTSVGILIRNKDQRPHDYGKKGENSENRMQSFPRPSHADFTYLEKYGVKASSGGGRSSARETIGRVAAGAIAEKYLKLAHGVTIVAWVSSVGKIHQFPPSEEHPTQSTHPDFLKLLHTVTRETVDSFEPVRCPNAKVSARMAEYIADFRDRHDSIGGTVTCVIRNCPSGLGEPVFDKLEAKLAHAMMSIPATKGVEVGSGFGGCEISGSEHNDPFIRAPELPSSNDTGASRAGWPNPKLRTKTNNSGGIQGGISNGEYIYFRVAFKAPATIGKSQKTATYDGEEDGILEAKGRHDPCVVPRAVPIVEAMAALVVADMLMAQYSRQMARTLLPPLKAALPAEARGAEPVLNGTASEKTGVNGVK